MRRAWTATILIGLVLACGDDGDAGAETGATSGTPSTSDAPGSSSGNGDDDGAPGTSSSESGSGPGSDTGGSSDGGSDGSTTAAPSDDSSSGGGPVPIELINDGWPNSGPVGFQMGFAMDECWASTYVPEPEHYPFEVIGVSMVVGGEDMGDADFSFAIWSVDENNQPLEEIDVGSANISGDDNALDGVPLEILDIVAPPFDSGNFAIVVCFTSHGGFPAIARDDDGLTHLDRNWIRLTDGTWSTSGDLGVTGDWIMRAAIRPM